MGKRVPVARAEPLQAARGQSRFGIVLFSLKEYLSFIGSDMSFEMSNGAGKAMVRRKPPPPDQHALDVWQHEIACPACNNRDRHSLRLLAPVDILFCSKCWTRIELTGEKAAIAPQVRAANEVGRSPPQQEGADSTASEFIEPVVAPEARARRAARSA
jgi:hypothetical protein